MSMGELGSLGVPVVLNTDGLSRGLASVHTRLRDANGRFTAAMSIGAAAGRYTDAMGRLREANGRFATGMGGTRSQVVATGNSLGRFGAVASRTGSILGGALRGVLGTVGAVNAAFRTLTAERRVPAYISRMRLPALVAGGLAAGGAA